MKSISELQTEQKRERDKELIKIMKSNKYEDYDKIVKYRLFIGKDKPVISTEENPLYWQTGELLKEEKFFTVTGKEKHKEVFVTGAPVLAREICEYFATCEGVSKDNIEELGELTEEEKEEIKKIKTENLLSDLENYKRDVEINYNSNITFRGSSIIERFDGTIHLIINTNKAFVDLEEGTFDKVIKILDEMVDLDYTLDTVYSGKDTFNLFIKTKHTQAISLWSLLMRGFGRSNMRRAELSIE